MLPVFCYLNHKNVALHCCLSWLRYREAHEKLPGSPREHSEKGGNVSKNSVCCVPPKCTGVHVRTTLNLCSSFVYGRILKIFLFKN